MEDLLSGYGMMIKGIRHLSPGEAFEAIRSGAVLIDVRPPLQLMMKSFDVERIICCAYTDFKRDFPCIPKDKPVILADAVGLRSQECARILLDNGYSQVANMAGGIVDWEHDGLPLLKNPGSQLNGPCLCMLKPKKAN
jgi:rhodanese-related sulfurtransferase